jgi:GntR family transcriptional regulator
MEQGRALITFRLDPRTGVPAYRQLVDQVSQAIRLGLLRPGDQLPSVREVVTQISINPNTVHRAYREMETHGLVEGRPGLGTFVIESTVQLVNPKRQYALVEKLQRWVVEARAAGLDDEGIRAVMAESLREMEAARERR